MMRRDAAWDAKSLLPKDAHPQNLGLYPGLTLAVRLT